MKTPYLPSPLLCVCVTVCVAEARSPRESRFLSEIRSSAGEKYKITFFFDNMIFEFYSCVPSALLELPSFFYLYVLLTILTFISLIPPLHHVILLLTPIIPYNPLNRCSYGLRISLSIGKAQGPPLSVREQREC
jgi:hypothetical protein